MKVRSLISRRRRIVAVCTVLLTAQLAACNGDDNGNDKTATPSPQPKTVALTLSGRVTDAPVANAEVTVTVGGEEFTTTADEGGNYSIEVEIDEADADQFVTLHARGVGEQSFIEFTSLAGSFESLAEQAGDDDTLSSSENFSTQITNVSTAEAVLIREANGGEPVTSNATLQSISATVNAQDVLDLAAAIKLVVDDGENYSMPEGQTSILDLASDPDARRQFIDDTYEQNPDAFAAAQTSIVQDEGLSRPIDTQKDLSFTAALVSTEPDFSFNYSGRVSHYDFRDDGTGSVSSGTFDQEMTWAAEGSTIHVTYTSPVEIISYEGDCAEEGGQAEAHYLSNGSTIAFISERTVAITTTSDVTYPHCPSLEPREDVSTVARTVLTTNDFQTIDIERLRGQAQTIYVHDGTQNAVIADIADFSADGTGLTRLTSQSFTWQIDETGKTLTASFNDGTQADYRLLRDMDELSSDWLWEVRTAGDGPVYTDAGASVYLDPEHVLAFAAAQVPGRYYQFGVGEEGVPDTRLKGFRLRFDADLTGAQESDFIDENDEVVTEDENYYASNRFRWSIDHGELVVRRTWDLAVGAEACLFGEPNCQLYDERRIIPLSKDGARMYWLEVRRSAYGDVTADTPATYLVRFYDYESFAEAASGRSAKTRLAPLGSKTRALLRGKRRH